MTTALVIASPISSLLQSAGGFGVSSLFARQGFLFKTFTAYIAYILLDVTRSQFT
jgi:hypothetical protein